MLKSAQGNPANLPKMHFDTLECVLQHALICFHLDSICMLCSYVPVCILMNPMKPVKGAFEGPRHCAHVTAVIALHTAAAGRIWDVILTGTTPSDHF
jgi:hypothetical protein